MKNGPGKSLSRARQVCRDCFVQTYARLVPSTLRKTRGPQLTKTLQPLRH